ncbi:recombinase RecT [Paenibacillus humicus]|uniref:recombinase RecT n=1 Tax=Paenibacillus humicus TaxID=412861 RepID=UPI003F17F728
MSSSRSTAELGSKLQTRTNNAPAAQKPQNEGLKSFLAAPAIKKRFEEVLDKRAPQFMSSMLNLYTADANLQKCEPMSVIASCMVAATLDLPVDRNLGYAWIVPYKGRATFQMGYKGYIQLALRTGKYKSINVTEVYEGELVVWNRLTEEFVIDFDAKTSDKIIGYAGYFELVNGFRKTVYWTAAEIEDHRKKFSKSDFGWKNDYDGMALKTVIRNMLSKWGILSIEMQMGYSEDVNPRKTIELQPDGLVIEMESPVWSLDPIDGAGEMNFDGAAGGA